MGREIFLMNQEIMDLWPSLESQPHSEAMSADKFTYQVGQMHEFLTLVVKVAFNHLYRDPQIPEAGQLYDSFFPKKQDNVVFNDNPMDPTTQEFRFKILTYVNNYVLSPDQFAHLKQNGHNDQVSIQEQMQQCKYTAMVILLRTLKTMRLQDSLGQKIQQRHLFVIACMHAANQCDNNMPGKPIFMKSLLKSTFIASTFLEC
jgi:hypothetical protein